MATKAVKGHALVKTPERDENPLWQCECGALYGAAAGDDRISRVTARERHRFHLTDVTGQLAAAPSTPASGHKSVE
jgi:hypothetical protein